MIKKLLNTIDNQKILTQYLQDVDNDFVIPLSKLTDLRAYSIKLLKNGVVLVSIEHDTINGLLTGYCNDMENGNATISILSVKNNSRGQGIARQLVNSMIDTCLKAGMKRLYVDSVNPIAVGLYKSFNFQVDGVESYDGVTKTYLINSLF